MFMDQQVSEWTLTSLARWQEWSLATNREKIITTRSLSDINLVMSVLETCGLMCCTSQIIITITANVYWALCARLCFKCFTHSNSLNPHNNHMRRSTVLTPILQAEETELKRERFSNIPQILVEPGFELRQFGYWAWVVSHCIIPLAS